MLTQKSPLGYNEDNPMQSKLIAFVIAETPRSKKGAILEQKPAQSAPQYYESLIPQQFEIQEEKGEIDGRKITFFIKSYPPDNVMAEATVAVDNPFSQETFQLREKLIDGCHKVLRKFGAKTELSEEYSVAVISGYQGDPDEFLKTKAAEITGFLKSERLLLDEKEIEYTLSKQIKYAKDDLVIVDWDGAFIFEPSGQIESTIDLFQAANLQLLRYRILDGELDERLKKTSKLPEKTTAKYLVLNRKEITRAFREVIAVRTQAISDFQALDRDVKMIGDWYSARIYDLVSKKFKLDEWRKIIQDKLNSLEDIYNIVAENFSVSTHRLLEIVQIALFFVLQAGWFALLILEFFYFTR